jgi:tetratricopeptide (TPR) repeat protein
MKQEFAGGAHSERQIDLLAADVGQRIRHARKERGMSLADVGQNDLTRSFLSLVELGRSRISLRALSIVAERLDLPISYFLEDSVSGAATAIDLTLELAEADVARGDAESALKKLKDLDVSPALRPRRQYLRGKALTAIGAPRDAIVELRDGLAVAKDQDDGTMTAYLQHEMGRALYATANYDEALGYLRDALDGMSGENADPTLLGRITIGIGHILYIRGDSQAAIEHYERARALFTEVSDLNTLGTVYSGLSLAYNRKGDVANALRYSRLSVAAFTAHQNEEQAARELNNLAVRYGELDDLTSALSCGEQAVARARTAHAREIEAVAHSTLAALHLRLDDFDAAGSEAEMAKQMAQNDTDPARIDAWVVQAKIAQQQGSDNIADELFRRALDAQEDAGFVAAYADTALSYSLLLRQRGDIERALEFAVRAAQVKSGRS